MTPPGSAARFTPSGIVTLTTDFGTSDPYVGMLKGVVLGAHPAAVLVDLTHGVPPQDVRVAAWFLAHAVPYFARGTVHLAVVDPGVGSARRLLVAEDRGSVFLAPDNGLLPAALSPAAEYAELDVARFTRGVASRTFHGRDILAPAAAALAAGLDPARAGRPLGAPPVEIAPIAPRRRADGGLEAEVVLADHYGNLVLGVRPDDLAGDHVGWRIELAGETLAIAGTYADVAPGTALALVDSYGAIEIAVRDGNARRELGLSPGARVILRRQG